MSSDKVAISFDSRKREVLLMTLNQAIDGMEAQRKWADSQGILDSWTPHIRNLKVARQAISKAKPGGGVAIAYIPGEVAGEVADVMADMASDYFDFTPSGYRDTD